MAKKTLNKKEIVCQAAIEVIAREGFYNASIDKIASAAGVAVGTIYNYFENKNDILNYIFQRELEKRKSLFQELEKKELHPLEKLKLILELHFQEVKKNPDLFRVLLGEKTLPHLCHFKEKYEFEGMPHFIEKIIARGIADGYLRPCDEKIISFIIFGSLEGLMSRYLVEIKGKKESPLLDKGAREMIDTLKKGLLSS